MSTALNVSSEQMATYRATAKRLQEQEKQELAQRRERAWAAARRAAHLLRARFGATRVVVFGSLIHEESFTHWSDVDIAAWGIDPADTFRAIGAVLDVDQDLKVNLVDMEACRPSLRASIEGEGQSL